MKRFFLWIPALIGLSAMCCAQSRPSSAILLIEDVTVIDATGAPAQPHRTVVVRGNRIEGIYDDHRAGLSDVPRIDGKGKFLIPGLWDMHVHIVFGNWFPHGKEITLPLFIANGITGVRDMGGEMEVLQ
jgi:predicted amidohydrolase